MKRTLLSLLVAFAAAVPVAAQTFVRGADVSWSSEMEASGKSFYNAESQQCELMQLMHEVGMNAIRLRVWVNPENAYGPWSDKADVVAKAKRAQAAGLQLMIDFHYSDFFTDPGRQTKPAAWASYSFDELKDAVASHTKDVLTALKDENIDVRWVQVGNETSNGMLWPEGSLWTSDADKGWSKYVALSNAGYYAVKAVMPDVKVIVHHDKGGDDQTWFYTDFKRYGGKFDMIGLSHYPTSGWSAANTSLATNVRKLYTTHRVPVMIVETGYSVSNESVASDVMTDLFTKLTAEEGCTGIFYWEPEVYDWWKPAYYKTLGWNAYDKSAFKWPGTPTKALDAFRDPASAVTAPSADGNATSESSCYDLTGRPSDFATRRGIVIVDGRKVIAN